MKVKCPTCGRETVFSSENLFRPFCSERCQTLDLGAWADERYAVPVEDSDSVNQNSQGENGASEDLPPKHHLN